MGLEKLFRDAVVDEGDALCAFDPFDHFFFEFSGHFGEGREVESIEHFEFVVFVKCDLSMWI